MTLVERILLFFGYVPKANMENQTNFLKTELALRESEYKTIKEDYDDLCDRYNDATQRLNNLQADSMESLKAENAKLRSEIDKVNANVAEAEEYYKTVQKQITELTSADESYKFRYNMEFAGATTLKSSILPENGNVKVTGRTILMDDTTARIQAASSLRDKYTIGLNYLLKTGLLNRLAQSLIEAGALQFTYGYTKSTTIEVYYAIEAIVPNTYIIETDEEDAE